MNLFYNDFDKRFLSALRHDASAPRKMSDAEVVREIATLWVESGGDAGGLDDEYVGRIKAEIKRIGGAS